MMLTGEAIRNEVKNGRIIIGPFDPSMVNPNSYNVTLGDDLKKLKAHVTKEWIDPRWESELIKVNKLTAGGFLLNPNCLYLGHTRETVGSDFYVPMLSGLSSLARLGLSIHCTAGFGDVGFLGEWTLEITTVHQILLFPGMMIGQFYFETLQEGEGVNTLYNGKYQYSQGVVGSRTYKEYAPKGR